jgi:hypothetical protein
MPCDAVVVSVADYPMSNKLLRSLPGAARDSQRMNQWLQSQQDVRIQNFAWPQAPAAGAAGPPPPWNSRGVEATMHQLLLQGLHQTQDRLFFYASAHGMSVPASPAMPAVFCASHYSRFPDLFLSSGWVPQFTSASAYNEYLCFFDCCNDWQPGTLPIFQALNLPPREDPPRVLVVAACKPGQQALDTPTGGVFTDVLLEALTGSAGAPGKTPVTAADIVAYLKEVVPLRAAQAKPGHVQTPVEWVDPNGHVDLNAFVLFQRAPVHAVDVTALLAGNNPAGVEVQSSDLEPAGMLQAGPAGQALLPPLLPGKYVLRAKAAGWKQAIRLKTTVGDDGTIVAKAEPL